ncbi:MAG TPA: DoxX family membrane protein [Solirubrobacteraceae bacterium]|nr:DoxX family membrane protein [Solirubrobacteraceae bacterium]
MRWLQGVDAAIHRGLREHSIAILRVVVGLVFLLFGLLKFFPDVSPVEELTIKTTDAMSFDLVPGHIAIVLVACSECIIGLLLIAGRFLRIAIYLLAGQLIGILAPLVLFTGRLFDGPHNAPTLEGQYVIKDLILVAAGLVVASTLPGLVPGADSRSSSTSKRDAPRTDWTDHSAVRR